MKLLNNYGTFFHCEYSDQDEALYNLLLGYMWLTSRSKLEINLLFKHNYINYIDYIQLIDKDFI